MKITFYANETWNTINLEHVFSMHTLNRTDDNRLFIILSSGAEVIFEIENYKITAAIEKIFREDNSEVKITPYEEYAILREDNVLVIQKASEIRTFKNCKTVIC